SVNFETDVMAFNKYFGWYYGKVDGLGKFLDAAHDAVHAAAPNRAIGLSEYGAGGSVYQHADPAPRPNPAGPFHPEEYQDLVHESAWQQIKTRPYLWCKLVWNMFDFASDARHEGDTNGRNDKGLVTFDHRTRKDAF